ncbi:MAG TPA: GYD domain-containing protein [Acidimicrobiales bacterium]|nr:GYD domain-containing protein [Acidimicrobiales bacterium]
MGTYIMLMKFTTPGFEGVKDGKAGRAAGKKAAKAMGITWKQQYLVMGGYDIINILEAPDDEAMARFALMAGQSGSFTTETMRVFTEGEADALVQGLGDPG